MKIDINLEYLAVLVLLVQAEAEERDENLNILSMTDCKYPHLQQLDACKTPVMVKCKPAKIHRNLTI
jgi:5-formaminoimidazole-4-carboxamide-1-beta-D-ribofuranosyl 5'-monophosphate synthetase